MTALSVMNSVCMIIVFASKLLLILAIRVDDFFFFSPPSPELFQCLSRKKLALLPSPGLPCHHGTRVHRCCPFRLGASFFVGAVPLWRFFALVIIMLRLNLVVINAFC